MTLNVPYQAYTKRIFYHGDIADGYSWLGWDGWPGAQITADISAIMKLTGDLMAPYLNRMDYTAAGYKLSDTRIDLGTAPGFTLVKDSYFPYWKSRSGDIMPTSQGFMLVQADTGDVILDYRKPLYYILASAFTIMGLIGAVTVLLVALFWPNSGGARRRSRPERYSLWG